MVEFSKVNIKDIDSEEEEAGEEVESAPPQKVGEDREIGSNGLKKKLIKGGRNWETPQFGDEVTTSGIDCHRHELYTWASENLGWNHKNNLLKNNVMAKANRIVHYVGRLLDGSIFVSTRASSEPITFKLGHGDIPCDLDRGIVTMRKGEMAIFTLPSELAYGALVTAGVPPNSIVQFEVELLSWITVVDVCKDGGILKKILENGEQIGPPGDLDEVCVSYKAMLLDGSIVAETPEEGIEFYVKDGHFCPALIKALKTMKRGERANLVVQPQNAFAEVGEESTNKHPSIQSDSVLSIFVKLLSLKPVIDITGDLKVKKKVLKEGEGFVTANEGASVTMRYTAMLEDGTVFEKRGVDGQQLLQFITGEEQVIAGLDRAASTMRKNERAIVTISPEYGFGNTEVKTDLSLVPPSSTLLYEVEMLDFIREKAPWEMSTLERIETAGRKKDEGNQLFKNRSYQRAAKKYDKAIDYVSEDGHLSDDDEKIIKSLRLSCWLNSAACCLKLNNYREVINLCSKILDVESCNVKALYRRAHAYIGVSELLQAELDIKKALEVDPQNKEVKVLQKNLKELQAESNKRDAKLYRAIFSPKTTDDSVAAKRLKIG